MTRTTIDWRQNQVAAINWRHQLAAISTGGINWRQILYQLAAHQLAANQLAAYQLAAEFCLIFSLQLIFVICYTWTSGGGARDRTGEINWRNDFLYIGIF